MNQRQGPDQPRTPASPQAPSLSDVVDPQLSKATLGAYKLFEFLSTSGMNKESLAQVSQAMHLMFDLHREQTRPDGSPYVNHTLLVTQVLARKFEITEPSAIVAALLHDAPEDQTPRIGKLLANDPNIRKDEAIKLLCKHIGVEHSQVAEHLHHLTNPDFKEMTRLLKQTPPSEGLQGSKAYQLVTLALPEISQNPKAVQEFLAAAPSRDIKNLLYLGHWHEIMNGDPLTRAIKLADLYTNGLQRNRLHAHLDALPAGSLEKERTEQFAENLRRKYAPVVALIKEHLSEALSSEGSLVSPRGDILIARAIGKAEPLYATPYKR